MIYDLKHIPLRNIYYKFVKANKYPLWKKKHLDKKLKRIHNIHLGEECFIVGNGPSLKVEDLEQINRLGIKTFAANAIYKVFDETEWRPTYYCAQDQQVIDTIVGEFSSIVQNCNGMFVRRDVYKQLSSDVKKSEKLFLPRLVMQIRKNKTFGFSADISNYAFDGCTITYLMLQIAYYMGFKKIYLIGIDHNFPLALDENDNIVLDESIQQHFFEKDKNIYFNPARPYETTLAYKSARVFLENHDVEIYNATRGGKLEVFNRVSLDSVLGGKTNED